MNREILEPFVGCFVKIILDGNFALSGTIEAVYDDAILFTTTQQTSVITFGRILEVRRDNRRER